MCTFPAIASVGLQAIGGYLGQKATASAAQAQMNAQAKAAITEMNYAFQNYEQQRIDAFDAAVNELEKLQHNAMQLNSGVEAAINENQAGRTAVLLMRNTEGDTARASASIKDNYERQSNEIDLNKEAVLKSTKNTIDNINMSAPKMPNGFQNFLSVAGSALGAYTTVQNQKATLASQGMKQDFWTGGAQKNAVASAVDTANATWVGNVPRSVYEKTKKGNGRYM